jgi:hypothetical protein
MKRKTARKSEAILRKIQTANIIKPKNKSNCVGLIEYSKPDISIIVLPMILLSLLAK